MKTDKLTYETESQYADFRKISIEFHGDSSTSDVVELCRRLLVAAGHHPDNVEFDSNSSTSDVVEICRRLLVAAGHHPNNVNFKEQNDEN